LQSFTNRGGSPRTPQAFYKKLDQKFYIKIVRTHDLVKVLIKLFQKFMECGAKPHGFNIIEATN